MSSVITATVKVAYDPGVVKPAPVHASAVVRVLGFGRATAPVRQAGTGVLGTARARVLTESKQISTSPTNVPAFRWR